jgi:hypothetical protein
MPTKAQRAFNKADQARHRMSDAIAVATSGHFRRVDFETRRPTVSLNIDLDDVDAEIACLKSEKQQREKSDPFFASCASFAWPVLDASAFHGIAGEIARTIEPHTEADPVALLLQILVAAGNVIGRLPHYQVESDHHRANLFAVLVGDSAKGRKGTALDRTGAVWVGRSLWRTVLC